MDFTKLYTCIFGTKITSEIWTNFFLNVIIFQQYKKEGLLSNESESVEYFPAPSQPLHLACAGKLTLIKVKLTFVGLMVYSQI